MTRSRSAEATIKGFNYQFDATILKILSNPGEAVVEGVEDIDLHDQCGLSEYVQCKYYAGTNLTNSGLREIITPMLEHYKTNGESTYTIYGYFNNVNTIDLDNLNVEDFKERVLRYTKGNDAHDLSLELNLSDSDITDFVDHLQLIESNDYETHKEEVKTELGSALGHSGRETIDFFYCNAFYLIADLSTKSTANDRKITKEEFLSKVNTKDRLYSYWNLIEVGERSFCSKMRSDYFTQTNVSPYDRIFVVHTSGLASLPELKEIVLKLERNWSNSNNRRAQKRDRYAPYIFFYGLPEQMLIELMNSLYNEDVLFVDGYPFKGSAFSWKAISEKPDLQRLIKCRIFHSTEDIQTLINNLTGTTKEIYEFYTIREMIDLQHDIKHVKIPINSLSMVKNII